MTEVLFFKNTEEVKKTSFIQGETWLWRAVKSELRASKNCMENVRVFDCIKPYSCERVDMVSQTRDKKHL